MRTIIVHNPVLLGHTVDDVKTPVVNVNIGILQGKVFPGGVPYISLYDMIGDPNHNLSDRTCQMLFDEGLLGRTAVLNVYGKQEKLKLDNDSEELLWDYAWLQQTSPTLYDLPKEKLSELAWDLRHHPNFCHISVVTDTEPEVTSDKESLDSVDSEVYDDAVETDF